MSRTVSLKPPFSDVYYYSISTMSKETPGVFVGQDCCILNSIDTVFSSLTVI